MLISHLYIFFFLLRLFKSLLSFLFNCLFITNLEFFILFGYQSFFSFWNYKLLIFLTCDLPINFLHVTLRSIYLLYDETWLIFSFSFMVISFCVLWKKLLTNRIHGHVLPYFLQKLYGFSYYVELCYLFQIKFLHKVRLRSKFVQPSFFPFVFPPSEHLLDSAPLTGRIFI